MIRDWWVSCPKFTCWVRTRKDEWGEWVIDSAPFLWTFHCQPARALGEWIRKNFGEPMFIQIRRPADFKSERFL